MGRWDVAVLVAHQLSYKLSQATKSDDNRLGNDPCQEGLHREGWLAGWLAGLLLMIVPRDTITRQGVEPHIYILREIEKFAIISIRRT